MRVSAVGLALLVLICSAAIAQKGTSNPLENSRVFAVEQTPPKTNANGSETRFLFTGTLATGESVSAHESIQPAGTKPPVLHKIQHSEFIVIEQGTVEYHHDKIVERAGPGSILYVKIGTDHFVANVGDGPAKYAVIQIGGDTKK